MTIFGGAIDTLATLAQQVYHAGQIMFGGPPHPFAVDEAAPKAERCAREAGFTAPVKHGPGSRLAEPHLRRESIAAGATPSPGPIPSAADEPAFAAWLASIDARLAAIQDHLTSAAPGATFTPDAAPESPAPPVPEAGAGHPGFPNWCAAEMRQVADILATTDSPFALGYANDLRAAATEISATERN